jgi:REP element-mobilizing transposase RayT
MKYDPEKHNRRSIRLKNYDYSKSGAYFITICTKNRQCLFGEIVNGEMILNDGGKIVEKCWIDIPEHFPNAILDEFIIMPNHIHGIIILNELDFDNVGANMVLDAGANNYSPPQNDRPHGTTRTIGSIIRGFKIGVTKWFRQNSNIKTVWQRNYYDHIIRNEIELIKIRKYIINNPKNWLIDNHFRLK